MNARRVAYLMEFCVILNLCMLITDMLLGAWSAAVMAFVIGCVCYASACERHQAADKAERR